MFSHDEYETLHAGAGLFEQQDRGRLQLTGGDRLAYLHGLLTNDITALTAGQGCYAALLTPQGRMISDMRVSELGDRVLVDLPAATTEAVRQRLADFIFSEDVEVQELTAATTQSGLYGPAAPRVLALATAGGNPAGADAVGERLAALPLDHNQVLRFEGVDVVAVASDDFGAPGFELVIDTSHAAAFAAALQAAGAAGVSLHSLEVSRVEAGRPRFGVDMDEHTIPLEAGIEARAISLTKGCYVGQEVIIRVLHRGGGRVARRLVGLEGSAGVVLQAGERLHTGGKDVGVITSAVKSPRRGGWIGLGYVHRDHTEPGFRIVVGTPEAGREATVVALPF